MCDIQDSGFITELGLSLKLAWRIVRLDREKGYSCPGYHIEVFFGFGLSESLCCTP